MFCCSLGREALLTRPVGQSPRVPPPWSPPPVVAVLKEAVSVRSEVSFTVRGFCVLPSLHLSKAKPVFGVAWTVCVLPSSKVPPPETLPWLSLAERTVSVCFFGFVVPPGLEGLPSGLTQSLQPALGR